MKLRNKETGEIREVSYIEIDGMFTVPSLATLYENWEDYTPAEPLIKDEKIRKAVRAWAEAFDVEKIYYDAKMLRLHDSKCKTVIGIKYPILGVWDRKDPYTIAELCGEEEE